jgi:spermidine/putrescine transport system permease protein
MTPHCPAGGREPDSRSARRRLQASLLLAPLVLTLGALFVVPQLVMFAVSLGSRTAYGGVAYDFAATSYLRATESVYLTILLRSIGLALLTTVACLVIGYPTAWWLARRAPAAWRHALLVLVVLPLWTSFLVRMYAWIFLLRSEGLLGLVLGRLSLPAPDILYTDAAVFLGQVYGELPFMILPLYAAIEGLDRSLLEAAADLGASRLAVLRRVALPLTRAGILAGCLLVFIPSLGAYLAPDLLGGARTAYVGTLIQSQLAVARDVPFGAALSFVLSAVVAVLLLLLRGRLADVAPHTRST